MKTRSPARKTLESQRLRLVRSRLVIVVAMIATAVSLIGASPAAVGAVTTSAYRPVQPFRAGDTRTNDGFTRIDAHTLRLQVAGRNGVPADATAAAITMVATNGQAPGHALTYQAGEKRPNASNINYEAYQTYSTGAIVPLSAGGAIDVYTLTPVDIIIDVTGAFVPVTTSSEGRFIAIEPSRVTDTRATTPFDAGETRDVSIQSAWKNATGALVTLTVIAPNVPGFFTAYATGNRPDTSTVNVPDYNATRATTTIVPISDKVMKLYSSHGGNVIVDVIGFFTGPYADESSEGLFVATTPKRRVDTRSTAAVGRGEARSFDVEGGVAVGSLAIVTPASAGFASMYANGTPRPATSTINATNEMAIANMAVARASESGVNVYSSTTAHYIFDQFGYFTSDLAEVVTPPTSPTPPTTPPATTVPPTTPPTPPTTAPPTTTPPPGCSVSALLVPSCGVWLGSSTPPRNGGGDVAVGLAEYEAVAQNTPDILHYYKSGGGKFPTAKEIGLAKRPGKQRSLLLYNWKPSRSATWRQIADGAVDADIAKVAAGLKSYPHKLFLNIFHEPEDNVNTSPGSGMTPDDYRNMYRHVVDELNSHGVTNAVYVWNVMGYYGWDEYLDALYPGNSYVDWVCGDPYAKDNNRRDIAELINKPRENLNWPGFYGWATARAPGKPIMLCEFGVDLYTNSNPASILQGNIAQMLAQYPMLKAMVYWNSVDDVNARLDNTSTKGRALGAAYRNFAGQSIFNQTSPNSAP